MAEEGTYCRECGRPWEDEDSLNAQRYEKLKAYMAECRDSEWAGLWQSINLDSTVDALPEGGK